MDIFGMYFIMQGAIPSNITFTWSHNWLRSSINPKNTKLIYILMAYEYKSKGHWYLKAP